MFKRGCDAKGFLCVRGYVRFACVVPIDGADDDAVPLCSARAGAFETKRKCRLEIVQLVVLRDGTPTDAQTYAQAQYYSTVRSCVTKRRIGRTATAACNHGCYNVER